MKKKNTNLIVVLLAAWVTYVAAYLCRVNLSTVMDKLAVRLDVSLEYLGIASSIYFVTYAVGQLLNGIVGDRVNPHRFIMLALTMTGVINVVIGLQTNGTAFLLLWGLNGFCQSMFWSTLLRLLSFYSWEDQRKNVSTVMSTTSVTGYLLSWVALGYLFRPAGPARYFVVPGVIALLLIPVWIVLSRKMPFVAEDGSRAPTPPLLYVAKEFLHDRLYFICLLCMLVGAIQEGAVFWLPTIFTNVLDLGENSLLLLVLVPFSKLAGVFLARSLLSRFGENARRAATVTLSLTGLIALILLLTSNRTSLLTVLLIAVMIMVVNASNWFVISYLPLHFASRNIVASLVGVFDFSTYIGASWMSGLLGVLLARFGWISLTVLWLALALASLALVLTGAGSCLALRGSRRA